MVKIRMRKSFFLAQLTLVTVMVFSLGGCGATYEDKPDTGALAAPEYTTEVSGRIARFTNGAVMLLSENHGAIDIGGKVNLDGLGNGDRVTIYCDGIMETYPGQAIVKEMLFHEKGTVEDLDVKELENLREMGYELEKEDEAMTDYISIDMETAKAKFETEGDYIILDVRRADEFANGHIPGAINVANEDITDKEPTELADKSQTIYVYCRSGNRSKQASSKLAAMGYTNIIEFGGIIDWTGEIEK